jgi:hypothetical protein
MQLADLTREQLVVLVERLYDELEMVVDAVADDPEKYGHLRDKDPVVGFVSELLATEVAEVADQSAQRIQSLESELAASEHVSGDLKIKMAGHRVRLAQAEAEVEQAKVDVATELARKAPHRERLTAERNSHTTDFDLVWPEGEPFHVAVTVGCYDDGRPAELFIDGHEGSFEAGLLDGFAVVVSMALQHGVQLGIITTKLRRTQFPPAGFTGKLKIPRVSSILDGICQWLDQLFPGPGPKVPPNGKNRDAADEELP